MAKIKQKETPSIFAKQKEKEMKDFVESGAEQEITMTSSNEGLKKDLDLIEEGLDIVENFTNPEIDPDLAVPTDREMENFFGELDDNQEELGDLNDFEQEIVRRNVEKENNDENFIKRSIVANVKTISVTTKVETIDKSQRDESQRELKKEATILQRIMNQMGVSFELAQKIYNDQKKVKEVEPVHRVISCTEMKRN